MKHVIAVSIMLIMAPAFAGYAGFDEVNYCAGVNLKPMVQCLQQAYSDMPAARAEKIAACFGRHGSDRKSVTRKQWLACGLPKRDLHL